MNHTVARFSLLTALCLALVSCGGKIATAEGQRCSNGINQASKELEDAKVKGFGGSIQWSKAAGLLTAASTQMQLEHFGSCIDKVERARTYIREAQK